MYTIKTEIFEGPLDVLLSLIEKRKLFINDISLAAVTDEFIEALSNAQVSMDTQAEFTLIASTLLLIKSRSLLPTINLTTEEEQSIDDLQERLAKLERTRELSKHIAQKFGASILFSKTPQKRFVSVFVPHESMTIQNLLQAAKNILLNFPKKEILTKAVVARVVSLEDMIDRLRERIASGLRMNFREFAGAAKTKEERVHVIVSFLAMLELVKQGIVAAQQHTPRGEIELESKEVSVPSYGM